MKGVSVASVKRRKRLTELRDGQPYNSQVRSWPEATQYNYRGGLHELVLFLRKPSKHEIRGIRRGPCNLRVYVDLPIVDLLFAFPRPTCPGPTRPTPGA